jgi:hypothetical protein
MLPTPKTLPTNQTTSMYLGLMTFTMLTDQRKSPHIMYLKIFYLQSSNNTLLTPGLASRSPDLLSLPSQSFQQTFLTDHDLSFIWGRAETQNPVWHSHQTNQSALARELKFPCACVRCSLPQLLSRQVFMESSRNVCVQEYAAQIQLTFSVTKINFQKVR